MFLIDTNVLSELRRQAPPVRQWIEETQGLRLYCSVISLGEIEKGIERRRQPDPELAQRLELWLDGLCRNFGDRALPVTPEIAMAWGRIAAGRTRDIADALIAATAIVHGLTLVTRNTRDFEDLPLTLFNPWQR